MRLIISLTALSLTLFLCPWPAFPVEPRDPRREAGIPGLPEEVWKRIQDLPPTALVDSIREERWEGTVYEATSVDGEVLQVAEDASILNKSLNGAAGLRLSLANDREIKFNELPELVQKSVRQEFGTVEIATVSRGHWSGLVYKVDFMDRGLPKRLKVTSEGTVMQNAFVAQAVDSRRISPQRTVPLEITGLPRPVRDAIRKRAGDVPVQEIREGRIDDARVYLVSFFEGEMRVTMLLDEEGRVVNERLEPRETALAAADLEGYERISVLELPAAVRSRVQKYAGPGQIIELYRTVADEHEIYQAVFVGTRRQTEMKLAGDGTILEVAQRPLNGEVAPPVARVQPPPRQESPAAPQESEVARQRSEIPPAVRQSIREFTPPGEIVIVTPETREGRVAYRVEVLDDGGREVWLDRDGTMLAGAPGEPIHEPAAAAHQPYSVHLPPAVRETLQGLRVGEIESARWTTGPGGAIIYHLQIRHNGRQGEIQVREDGYLLP